jgi:hypothetical protein
LKTKKLKRQGVSKNGRRTGHIVGSVYLVHAARALNGARHYLGFSTNVRQRIDAHRKGRGSPLLGEMAKKRIPFGVVRQWHKRDGYFEQELKRRFNLADLCPKCKRGR